MDGILPCDPSLKSNSCLVMIPSPPPVNGCFFVYQGLSGITVTQCQPLSCRVEADNCVDGVDIFKSFWEDMTDLWTPKIERPTKNKDVNFLGRQRPASLSHGSFSSPFPGQQVAATVGS